MCKCCFDRRSYEIELTYIKINLISHNGAEIIAVAWIVLLKFYSSVAIPLTMKVRNCEFIIKVGNEPLPDVFLLLLAKHYLSEKDCISLAISGASDRFSFLFWSNRWYRLLIKLFKYEIYFYFYFSGRDWRLVTATFSVLCTATIYSGSTSLLYHSQLLMWATATGSRQRPLSVL